MNMKKNKKITAAVLGTLIATQSMYSVFALGTTKTEQDKLNDQVNVRLLSFNDLHGQYDVSSNRGGIANLSAYLKQLQSESKNTITMSAGDHVGGSPAVAALKQDQPTLEMMREMNVDVVTTGNHEYDEGLEELYRLIYGGEHSSGLKWDGSQDLGWITANVIAKYDIKFDKFDINGDGKIDGNDVIKKGDPILNPYTIKEFDGVKVGIIGVVTTDTAKKVVPAGIKDVEFVDEVSVIDKYTEELKSQGVNTIVVLSHVPALTDKETSELVDLEETSDVYDIAQKVNGEVDVIIGADNHQYANSVVKREGKDDIVVTQAYSKSTNIGKIDLVIDKTTGDVISADNHQYANSVVKREGKDDIVVTQAYSKSTNIGKIDLVIDKTTGDVISSETQAEVLLVDPKKITPDAKIEAMVEKARADVKSDLERKVGYAEEKILRNIEGNNGESELGRMIAESQLWAVKNKGENVDISLMNIGGVRADLEAGDVTYDNGESELGRMIAESQLWAVKNKGENVDISLMNIGGVRADLEAGDVTYEDVYTVQPFGNDLTKLTLTGKQLKDILELQSINDWVIGKQEGKYNRPIMLQIDGFTYKWHPELENGKWVLKVDSMYLNDENNTIITDDTKINTVANIFLAQGGDGFTPFKQSTYEVIMGDLEAFEQYTEEFSKKDNNGNGIVGLSNIGIGENPNIINLDQNFNGVIDGSFVDTESHWAKKEIEDFTSKGLIKGYTDNTFKPENYITRAEFINIINSVYKFNNNNARRSFSDVSTDSWYYNDICAAVNAGYIDGYEDGTFRPNQVITREEAAKIVVKMTGVKGDGNLDINDANEVSDWAKEYVDAAFDNGVLVGYGDNIFGPKSNMKRAEAVVMLSRVLNK